MFALFGQRKKAIDEEAKLKHFMHAEIATIPHVTCIALWHALRSDLNVFCLSKNLTHLSPLRPSI